MMSDFLSEQPGSFMFWFQIVFSIVGNFCLSYFFPSRRLQSIKWRTRVIGNAFPAIVIPFALIFFFNTQPLLSCAIGFAFFVGGTVADLMLYAKERGKIL